MTRVLIVGGGGREHALAWKLSHDSSVDKIFAAPGNAGITEVAECVSADVSDVSDVADLAEELGVDLVVVGPEIPLVAGLVDELDSRGIRAFGPTAAAARIEGSKAWMKEICARAKIPTARSGSFTNLDAAIAFLDEMEPPYVVKADGLAAGKGVIIAAERAEAVRALEDALVRGVFGKAGTTVLVEEFLRGEELSVFCLTDGHAVLPLAAAQDFKRAYDDDEGPNTGGMGAYSPVPHMGPGVVARAVSEIFTPAVREMTAENARFRGLLYGGLMVTAQGPKLLEFNCRFGDPETQAVLPRLTSDLSELLQACAEGNLRDRMPEWTDRACVSVVLASGGYPGEYEKGIPIHGLQAAAALPDVTIFHAGTARRDGKVVTAGGRVLNVSALGRTIAEARARAYEAADLIEFEGKQCRRDIASRAADKEGAP